MKYVLSAALVSLSLSAAAAQSNPVTPKESSSGAARTRLDFQLAAPPMKDKPADPEIAAALHDVAASHLRTTVESLLKFSHRNTLSSLDEDLADTNVTAAAKWIHAEFEQMSQACGGCLEVKEDTFTEDPQTGKGARILKPTPITNVYAVMKGSDPVQSTRRILITGHYDTRISDTLDTHGVAPGANDDSSGTAVMLECARVLSRHKFPATIVFVAVAGEEQGLNGSRHLAAIAKSESWQLEAVLNNDIVGGDTTPGDTLQSKSRVRVFSEGISSMATADQMRAILSIGGESDSPSRELARSVADVSRTYFSSTGARPASGLHPVLVFRLDRYLRGGDHSAFNNQGFAAVRFTEWRENYDHQHQNVRVENGRQFGDLIQYDDFAYMARVARLNAATLATLASAPAPPLAVRLITRTLDNNSLLHWQPALTATSLVKYEVLWRETSAPDWQYATPALRLGQSQEGADLVVTVPVSKDNVLFGVRACDNAGHCSPAVAPIPAVTPAP